MSKVITPTIGRKVWYQPSVNDKAGSFPMQCAAGQPLDATIIAVWSDRMVNVLVTDISGKQFPVLSCELLQPGDEPRATADGQVIGRYVQWMPYQQGQAAKANHEPVVLTDADALADLNGTPRPDHPTHEGQP